MNAQPDPAQAYEAYLVPRMFRPFAHDLVARAAPQPGERVLDVGCGTGVVARLLAPLVGPSGSVTGLDPNAAMLAVARERAVAEGADIEWRGGDATALPFADGAFGLVVSQQALQFIPDRVAAAREMRRVLAPAGRAVVATWSPMETIPVIAAMERAAAARLGSGGVLAVPFSMGGPEALGTVLRAAGFRAVSVETVALVLRLPSYTEYIAMQIRGAAAVVPALQALSAEEREVLIRDVAAAARPEIEEYLEGEALNLRRQTDVATARA